MDPVRRQPIPDAGPASPHQARPGDRLTGRRRSHPDLAQVLHEPVIYLMWPRAALMQLAHPGVAPTEVESGVYGIRGAGRWAGTVNYLRVAACGDDEQRRVLAREVNRVHARVRVPADAPAGGRRPAFDPRNQLWVATTWFVSIVDTYSLFVRPLDDDAVAGLYEQFQRIGTLLQMSPGDWPADLDQLRAYVAYVEGNYPAALPRSASSDPEHVTAGDVAAQVFSTYSMPRRYVRLLPRIRLLTWGMAGERLRSIYGIEWSADHEHRFRRTVRTVARWQSCCPGPLRRRHGRRQARRRADRTIADRTPAERTPANRSTQTAVTNPHTNGRNQR
ncbi:oxygenase MpaB family protein [Gordonia paraffinivorans]|uniref:oxygenase MpaB family protein n=1 Tax=Gordonia paraffinivorans TaxID=175628 RepID=UPI003FCEB447